jgi:hypothetical protein
LFIIRGTVAFENLFQDETNWETNWSRWCLGINPCKFAYYHLCQTNITSYDIAGRWEPNPTDSYGFQERFYKNITENDKFNLTKDGFNGQNDLLGSITSQLGALPNQTRQLVSNDLPNKSALYPNIVHAPIYIISDDTKKTNVSSETKSQYIQRDIIKLLGSSDENKFTNAIWIGSVCYIPTKQP